MHFYIFTPHGFFFQVGMGIEGNFIYLGSDSSSISVITFKKYLEGKCIFLQMRNKLNTIVAKGFWLFIYF